MPLHQVGFINWHKGEQFDVEEYEHYEQVGWLGLWEGEEGGGG